METEPACLPDCLSENDVAAYASGRLPVAGRVAVDRHIKQCSRCLAVVAQVMSEAAIALTSTISSWPQASLTEGFSSRLPLVARARYRIDGEIACGGMGRVFAAHDCQLDRAVAIKEILTVAEPELVRRFEREVLLTARLQHPAIVSVLDAGRWESGEPFYAMRLVRGRSLAAALDGAQTLEQRLTLLPHVLGVAEAVAYAHAERVIHRDLKPANVLVGDFGETVVIDWGLAKSLDETEPPVAPTPSGAAGVETQAGTVIGTPAYMPPEQAAGIHVDERADVWALGAMLYHVLGGRAPGVGKTRPIKALARGAPEDIVTIVEKAMAPRPCDRYASAVALADDLRRFQTGRLVGAHRYTLWQLVRRASRRNRAAVSVGLALLVVLAAVSLYGVRRIVFERNIAETERDLAVTERAAAEKLVDFVLVDLKDQLTRLGRLEPLYGVGTEVDRYYRTLTGKLRDRNVESLRRRSQALEVLGDVLDARGEHPGAVAAYSQSAALLEGLTAAAARDRNARLLIARDRAKIAQAEMDGHDDLAMVELERALGILKPLLEHEGDAETGQVYADVLIERGDIFLIHGEVDRAQAEFHLAIDFLSRAPALAKEQRLRIALARSHERLGVAALEKGDNITALDSFRQQLGLCNALVAEEETPRHISLLEGAHSQIGRALQAKGQLADAQDEFDQALAAARRLVATDPSNIDWLHSIAVDATDVGTMEMLRKKLPAAERSFTEAYHAIDRVQHKDPGNSRWKRHVAVALSKLGQVKQDRHDLAGALADFIAAQKLLDEVLHAEPTNDKARQQLAIAYSYVGDLYLAENKPQAALEAYSALVDIARAAAEKNESAAGLRKILAVGLGLVASAHERIKGHAPDAKSSLSEGIARLKELKASARLDAEGTQYLAQFEKRLQKLQR